MKQEVIDYIKSRIVSSESSVSGDIETITKITFDSGIVATGCSIRPIDGFLQEEAQKAACDDAIGKLYAGVEFSLSKK